MRLLLVRHPKPDVVAGLCYGHMDVPLLSGWEREAQAIQTWLDTRFPERQFHSYHSPLQRTQQLALELMPNSEAVEALKEIHFGDWEGLTWSSIPPLDIELWANDLANANPYHGESLNELNNRVMNWFETIKQKQDDALLVTHSGVIKVLVSSLCQWPLEQCFRLDPGYSSVTELVIEGEYVTLKRFGAGDWLP